MRVFSAKTASDVRKMLHLVPAPAAPARRRRRWATRWAARPARAQAGGQGLRRAQVPRLVHRHRADRQPRIIVGVMVDEPSNGTYYGGTVAAPVFSDVVQQTLRMGVPPDMAVKPEILTQKVEESF
jgi:cell division protein FtsI (penicillin-binding protein 3)